MNRILMVILVLQYITIRLLMINFDLLPRAKIFVGFCVFYIIWGQLPNLNVTHFVIFFIVPKLLDLKWNSMPFRTCIIYWWWVALFSPKIGQNAVGAYGDPPWPWEFFELPVYESPMIYIKKNFRILVYRKKKLIWLN